MSHDCEYLQRLITCGPEYCQGQNMANTFSSEVHVKHSYSPRPLGTDGGFSGKPVYSIILIFRKKKMCFVNERASLKNVK